MRRMLLLCAALLLAVPGAAQEAPTRATTATLLQAARSTDDAVVFARSIAGLIRRAHEVPAERRSVTEGLTEFVGGGNAVKRAIAVDAVKSLPTDARSSMVPALSRMAERSPDGPVTRLYVRGLAEAGPPGLEALRQMVGRGRLSGDALALARMYLGA